MRLIDLSSSFDLIFEGSEGRKEQILEVFNILEAMAEVYSGYTATDDYKEYNFEQKNTSLCLYTSFVDLLASAGRCLNCEAFNSEEAYLPDYLSQVINNFDDYIRLSGNIEKWFELYILYDAQFGAGPDIAQVFYVKNILLHFLIVILKDNKLIAMQEEEQQTQSSIY